MRGSHLFCIYVGGKILFGRLRNESMILNHFGVFGGQGCPDCFLFASLLLKAYHGKRDRSSGSGNCSRGESDARSHVDLGKECPALALRPYW